MDASRSRPGPGLPRASRTMRLALASALTAAVACGPGEEPFAADTARHSLCEHGDAVTSADDGGALRVEVGGGLDEFSSLSDGGPVEVIYGPQGGYHIWTALRVWDLAAEWAQVTLTARLESEGTEVGMRSAVRVVFPAAGLDGARDRTGLFSFVDDRDSIRGERVVIRAEVESCEQKYGYGFGEIVVVPR